MRPRETSLALTGIMATIAMVVLIAVTWDTAENTVGLLKVGGALIFLSLVLATVAWAAARSRGNRLRKVIATIAIGTIEIDAQGVIQAFNPAAEKLFGYDSDEVVGRKVSILMPKHYGAHHDGYMKKYSQTGVSHIIGIGRELVGLRKDGTEFPLQLEVGEMTIGGQTRFIGSASDLTKMHALENKLRQSQKMEAVGQLTGGVAHDFNNLLTIIEGNLSLLEEGLQETRDLTPAATLEFIRPALHASRRGAELVHRLLAFSRKQALQPVALDIDAVLDGMANLLGPTLGDDIDPSWHLNGSDWLAKADASEFENVVLNLALNARDAMPGGGLLTIETREVTLDAEYAGSHNDVRAGDYVMMAMSDNGTGMDAGTLSKVFEPFFTTKDVDKGTGLGLSMVYGFAQQSGGHVTIDSELGVGTTVRLYLPRASAANAAAQNSDIVSAAELGGERILVVEDDDDVRSIAAQLLTRLGYTVLQASDGQTALDILDGQDDIDLLLTDVVMPCGLSGPDVAKAAQEKLSGLKVLYMSGYTRNAVLHHGRVDDGINLIGKPFSRADIGAKVREVLDCRM